MVISDESHPNSTMIPDFSNTYFPPPGSAFGPAAASQSSSSNAQFTLLPPPPPPPVRGATFAHSRQPSAPPSPQPYQPQSPYLQNQNLGTPTLPPYSPRLPPPINPEATPYVPHSEVLQTLRPTQSTQPTAQRTVSPAPRSPQLFTHFASFSLHHSDHIRFLRFPSTLNALIRATILSVWPRGIQSESFSSSLNYLDIKLSGNPWGISSGEIKVIRSVFGDDVEEQAAHAQRLICALLAALHTEGWVLMMSTDIANVPWDTDTLVFRHQLPAPAKCEWFSVVFSSQHKLRFVDAPRDLCMSVVARFISNKRELRHKNHKIDGCYEIKLTDMGLAIASNENMRTKVMFLDLLDCLQQSGWTVYASINQNTKSDSQGMTDTWYISRPVGWTQGAPVYHN